MRIKFMLLVANVLTLTTTGAASEIRKGELVTKLVPGPVEVSVLIPDGYDADGPPLPLLLYLHGGFGNGERIQMMQQPWFDELWESQKLPNMVVASPTVGTICGYLDFQDGSQKWETFILEDFLAYVRSNYNVSKERKQTVVAGWSMGGLGALRLAFKHPEVFAGVAAFEPGIMPALAWKDVKFRNRYWFADEHFEVLFGDPINIEYWRSNNPASIVHDDAATLRDSGLRIYIECGNEDYLYLNEGTEFLHNTLRDARIPHGFHLVDGADHVDNTHKRRAQEGLLFLGRVLSPAVRDMTKEKFRTWPKLMREVGPLPGQSDPERSQRIMEKWLGEEVRK